MKTGLQLIYEERQEQIVKHGFTSQIDKDLNDEGQLKQAAIFALTEKEKDYPMWNTWFMENIHEHGKTDVQKLAMSGALIAAEIYRLQES